MLMPALHFIFCYFLITPYFASPGEESFSANMTVETTSFEAGQKICNKVIHGDNAAPSAQK